MAIYAATTNQDGWGEPNERFSQRSGPDGSDAYLEHETEMGRAPRLFRWENRVCYVLVGTEWIPYDPSTHSLSPLPKIGGVLLDVAQLTKCVLLPYK
jgi:hypothetical protein